MPLQPPPMCVIYNPAAGRGQARRLIRVMRRDLGRELDLRPTHHPGHAEELARRAADDGCPIIVAAGGDGTVHEVGNGILDAHPAASALSVWPIGSANDYAFALGVTNWIRRWRTIELVERRADVGRIVSGTRARHFLNCCGLGFNGAVTFEARKIRWLRGMPLYGCATLKALWRHFDQPSLQVRFDSILREVPTLALSMNLGPREGNFPVTPRARLDAGRFEIVHAGPLSRWQALKLLPAMATGNLPDNNPRLWLGSAQLVQVRSPVPVRVHVDGEFFCHPEDGIRELEVELLPSRLRVLAAARGACFGG